MPDTKPAIPTFTQMLDAVPTRNVNVTIERHGLEVLLKVPVKPRWFLTNMVARTLLPQRKVYKLALDPVGREVWDACDGRQNVERIAEAFARRHRLRFHEARMSVMQFLRSLVERGCIVMVVPPGRDTTPAKPTDRNARHDADHPSFRDVRRPPSAGLAMEGLA
jgi:hypothetical protein